jgi:uncharacterized membrane protein
VSPNIKKHTTYIQQAGSREAGNPKFSTSHDDVSPQLSPPRKILADQESIVSNIEDEIHTIAPQNESRKLETCSNNRITVPKKIK